MRNDEVFQLLTQAARALEAAADRLEGKGESPPGSPASRLLSLLYGDSDHDDVQAAIPCGTPRGAAPDPCLRPLGIACPRCGAGPLPPVSEERATRPVQPRDEWILEAHGMIDLNRASLADLKWLPEVGPTRAARIVAARPLARVEDLARAGFGRRLIERFRPLAVFGRIEPARAPEVA